MNRYVWIAFEVTVTTTPQHEFQNIQKCLAAGFEHIVLLGHEKQKLHAVRQQLKQRLSSEALSRVHLLMPNEFIAFLDTTAANVRTGSKKIQGYKVNLSYKTTTKAEQKQKQEAVAKLIVDSMRRFRNEEP